MTEDQLNGLCREWQEVLRLRDWDVKVVVARAREFRNEGQGEIHMVQATRQAMIRIVDPLDYPPDTLWPQDMEQTLVHELLHIHFVPFDPDGKDEIAKEQAVDAIADGLVQIKRGR